MTPSKIMFISFNKREPVYGGALKCCFCGGKTDTSKKKFIKPTFTDLHYLRDEEGICEACQFCLNDRTGKEETIPSLRKISAIYLKDRHIRFTALELSEYLFNLYKYIKDNEEFVFCVNYSKKKHLFYKAKISTSTKAFYIQTDNVGFSFIPQDDIKYFNLIEELYSYSEEEAKKKNPKTFFTKKEIETQDFNINNIVRFGYKRFLEIKKDLEEIKNTPLLTLLVYVVRPKLRME